MALLTTAPYDAARQTAWVSDIIKASAEMRAAEARRDEQRRQHDAQQGQQALADQRRAFEFERRLEFDRAKTAADDTRADRALRLQESVALDGQQPYVYGGGAPPSSTVPSISSGTTSPAPTPSMVNPIGLTAENPVAPTGAISDGTVTTEQMIPQADALAAPSLAATAPAITGGDASAAALVPALPTDPGEGVTASLNPEAPARPAGPGMRAPTASQQIAELGQVVQSMGLKKKQGEAVMANVASSLLSRKATDSAQKPIVRNMADGTSRQYNQQSGDWDVITRKTTPATQSIEEATLGMDYDATQNTYKDTSGGVFFVEKSPRGIVMRPFKPSTKPAKFLWGDDGQMYPHDSQGHPLAPVPEGVQLRDTSKLQVVRVPGKGEVTINPDGTTSVLIPEGIQMTAKQKEDYSAAAQEVHAAKLELDTQQQLLDKKPRSFSDVTSWFGGGTQGSVDAAKKKLLEAQGKTSVWLEDFPQLRPATSSTMSATKAPAPQAAVSYPDEAAARKAGARSGEVVMVMDPSRGKARPYRLQ